MRRERLRFSPERAHRVAQEQWHAEQTGKVEPDGGYLLRLTYTDHRELIMDTLNHESHCEALGPAAFWEMVVQEIGKMGEKYLWGLREQVYPASLWKG